MIRTIHRSFISNIYGWGPDLLESSAKFIDNSSTMPKQNKKGHWVGWGGLDLHESFEKFIDNSSAVSKKR